MARLIDADAAIKAMNTVEIHFWEYAEDGVEKCVNILHNAPTADAVEVVRCNDCQKCLIDNSKMELHLCMKRPSFPVRVKLDDFCSYGERKDGDK